MRRASRFMPKCLRKRHWPAWIALALFAFVPVYFLLNHPVGTSAVIALLVVLSVVENKRHKTRLVALAESRSGESICEFARSFEPKEIDTWVVRAVYEQLQRYLSEDTSVPVRATDRLKEDLPIDSEDLEMDLMAEIAQRTGRSLDNTIDNPYYDKVRTVGDLVLFFNAQPRSATPAA